MRLKYPLMPSVAGDGWCTHLHLSARQLLLAGHHLFQYWPLGPLDVYLEHIDPGVLQLLHDGAQRLHLEGGESLVHGLPCIRQIHLHIQLLSG